MTNLEIAIEILQRTGEHPDDMIGEDGDRFWAAVQAAGIEPYELMLDVIHAEMGL